MKVVFTVTVETSRSEGKNMSREDVAESLQNVLDDANPVDFDVEESLYTVTKWEAEQEPENTVDVAEEYRDLRERVQKALGLLNVHEARKAEQVLMQGPHAMVPIGADALAERADVVAWIMSEQFTEQYHEGGRSMVVERLKDGWHVGTAERAKEKKEKTS